MNSSCQLCHNCGSELDNEKCPMCGNHQDARSHQNIGLTTCQFANFMRQQTLIGNVLHEIVGALKQIEDSGKIDKHTKGGGLIGSGTE